MALPDAIKVRVRRHLGYPVIGQYKISPAGGTLGQGTIGYRYFQAFGTLEYRMNNLLPSEEAVVMGNAVGSVAVVGPNPQPGDMFTVTISGDFITTPIAITVTAVLGDQPVDIVKKLAFAALQNQALQLAGFYAIAPYGQGPFSTDEIPLPECSFTNAQPFEFTVSFTGACALAILSNGQLQPPVVSLDGRTPTYGWIPILDGLESAWGGASRNLDTARADVWESRGNEGALRFSLYNMWQLRFSEFFGVEINPQSTSQPRYKRAGPMQYR